MSCYRLRYENGQTFQVEIQSPTVANGGAIKVCAAHLYRITEGIREPVPLRRENGDPLEVCAVTEHAALTISSDVLQAVTSSRLTGVDQWDG